MAQSDIVMAGFGGQGLMAIGKMLAKAAMHEGHEVTWMPAYGPEMRGGTANCCVVIDDKPIGTPIVNHNASAIVMNKQAFDKFEPMLAKGGLIIINSSLIDRKVARADLKALYVPANEIAEKEGSPKSANIVMLGAYVGATKVVQPETIEHAIEKSFKDKPKVAEANVRAFRKGVAIGHG